MATPWSVVKKTFHFFAFSSSSEKYQDQFKSCYNSWTSNSCLAIQFVNLFKGLMIRFWLHSTKEVTNKWLISHKIIFPSGSGGLFNHTSRLFFCQKNECSHKMYPCGSSFSLSNSTFVKYNFFILMPWLLNACWKRSIMQLSELRQITYWKDGVVI